MKCSWSDGLASSGFVGHFSDDGFAEQVTEGARG